MRVNTVLLTHFYDGALLIGVGILKTDVLHTLKKEREHHLFHLEVVVLLKVYSAVGLGVASECEFHIYTAASSVRTRIARWLTLAPAPKLA